MWRVIRGRRRAPGRLVAAIVLAGGSILLPTSAGSSEDTRSTHALERSFTVAFYGDSLTRGSMGHVEERIAAERPGWRVINRAFSGTAICDWFDQMRADAGLEPDLVVLQFSGNSFTECMAGVVVDSLALLAKYRTDAAWAAGFWTARGADVVFVGNPRDVAEPALTVPHPLDDVYRTVVQAATGPGVSFTDAPERALTVIDPADPTRAVFAREMPCRPSEIGMAACEDGQITVRSPDRRHFCPVVDPDRYPCSVYSAGSLRFGVALADAAIQHGRAG